MEKKLVPKMPAMAAVISLVLASLDNVTQIETILLVLCLIILGHKDNKTSVAHVTLSLHLRKFKLTLII